MKITIRIKISLYMYEMIHMIDLMEEREERKYEEEMSELFCASLTE